MEDGSTHLAHKLEHGVDLDSGAVVAVTVRTTDGGDTASLPEILDEVESRLGEVGEECREVVGDKGYHSNKTMVELEDRRVRSYVSEPDRGRRSWKRNPEAQKPTYANRRRIRGERGNACYVEEARKWSGRSLICSKREDSDAAMSRVITRSANGYCCTLPRSISGLSCPNGSVSANRGLCKDSPHPTPLSQPTPTPLREHFMFFRFSCQHSQNS